MWSTQASADIDHCDIHITTSIQFERYMLLKESLVGYELNFHLRALHSAYVNLLSTPKQSYPSIQVVLNLPKNQTVIYLYLTKDRRETLQALENTKILDLWKWHEMSITLITSQLQIFWMRGKSMQVILTIEHPMIALMRWFAIGSDMTVAYWGLFCRLAGNESIPHAWPPECTLNEFEYGYLGTQSISKDGGFCLPWIDSRLPSNIHNDTVFEDDGGVVWAKNYCRNPFNEETGAFCFGIEKDEQVVRKFCKIRKCKSSECRMAGTGNDYIGRLNMTRANRTCQNWNSNEPHVVDPNYLNDTLFAEMSSKNASNYCRNPSRSMVGAWCYTTDEDVPKDLCHVTDCIKPEETIILTRGNGYCKYTHIWIIIYNRKLSKRGTLY